MTSGEVVITYPSSEVTDEHAGCHWHMASKDLGRWMTPQTEGSKNSLRLQKALYINTHIIYIYMSIYICIYIYVYIYMFISHVYISIHIYITYTYIYIHSFLHIIYVHNV